MQRRLAGAFACVAAIAATSSALANCSATTELVVVVDTDLAPGTEVDEIEVSVDDGRGFVTRRSARVGPGGTPLPLTLGVTAGEDPQKQISVRAIARLRGAEVSSAELRTSFVEGESKLAHVSICRSCAASCVAAEATGASLPAWSGSPPTRNACLGSNDGGSGTDAELTDAGADGDLDADTLSVGLLAWWTFEEDGGPVVVDHAGLGNVGTLREGGTRTAAGGGNPGQGVEFRRVADESVTCNLPFGDEGSLAFFFRDLDDDAVLEGGSAGLFSNQTTTRDHFFVYRFFGDAAVQQWALAFQFRNDAGDQDFAAYVSPLEVVRNVWIPFVISWNTSHVRFRVGDTPTTTTREFARKPWRPTGQRCVFGDNVKGVVDNVRFYSRELTDAEMGALTTRPLR